VLDAGVCGQRGDAHAFLDLECGMLGERVPAAVSRKDFDDAVAALGAVETHTDNASGDAHLVTSRLAGDGSFALARHRFWRLGARLGRSCAVRGMLVERLPWSVRCAPSKGSRLRGKNLWTIGG
jgi:hypothetical protein